MAVSKLREWFLQLHDDFGDDVPAPDKVDNIIAVVSDYFDTALAKYLGAGDNGIAFLADDGDVIKFTIDKNEALLWVRLKQKAQTGIIALNDILNLSSSITGPTIVYVIKAEFAPLPVTSSQASLIKNAHKTAIEKTRSERQPSWTTHTYRTMRTMNLLRQFTKIADEDPQFVNIPDMLMDLADKHGGYIYDLQPDNFRRKESGEVVLIDPSVPDLVGDISNPEPLMYEDKIKLVLTTRTIYYE